MTSNILSPEERFAKIVHELAIELEKAETENAELRRKLMIANYPVEHAGDCGRCGEYKHLPWRDDEYGYICVSCLYAVTKAQPPESDKETLDTDE